MSVESKPIHLSFHLGSQTNQVSQASLIRQASHSPHQAALLQSELIQ